MKKNLVIKTFTVLSFCCSIAVFILYRTGYFDSNFSRQQSELHSSHNGGTITGIKDTTKHRKPQPISADSFASPGKNYRLRDSSKTKDGLDQYREQKKRQQQKFLMSSSKSMVVYKESKSYTKADSAFIDSLLKINRQ